MASGPVTDNITARYTITAGGGEITQSAPGGLEALSIEDHVDMIGIAEMTFSGDQETRWSSMEVSGDVEMKLGGTSEPIYKGTITGLRHVYQQGRDTLTVLTMDDMHKLAASRATKVFEDMTDSDIASQVISDGGCSPGTIDSTSEERKYIMQRNESHFHFLRRLAARNGMFVRANAEGKIDFMKPQFGGGNTQVAKADIISLDYTFSPRALPQSVTVYGWDYVKKEMVEGKASSGDIDTIGSGRNAVSSSEIWAGDAFVSDVWVNSQSGAKELAKGELNRMSRGFLRGRAIVQGNSELRAGSIVKFEGHQTDFNPEAYIVSSRHRVFVGSGFTTEVVFIANTYPDG